MGGKCGYVQSNMHFFAKHNRLIACLLDRNFKSSPIRIVNPEGYNSVGSSEEQIAPRRQSQLRRSLLTPKKPTHTIGDN